MLKVRNMSASWGHGEVVQRLDLDVAPGQIVALVGANGAGKTTALMALSNLTPQRSGTLTLAGRPLNGLTAAQLVDAGLVHCPEGRRVFAGMSVEENLRMGAYLRRDAEVAGDIQAAYARFARLGERRHQLAGTLSGGEQQMLAIARALLARPKVLLLDEPSLGLAPQVTEMLFAQIVELARVQRLGILLVEQNAALALQVADEALVLEHGQVALRGPSDALARDPRVQRAYLGG